jgi:heme-degrading monooxygenase HmoA
MEQTRRGLMGLFAGITATGAVSEAFAAGTPVLADRPMVARIWHGRTPLAKADEYKQYIYDVGIKKIASLPGNRGVQMMVMKTAEIGDFTVISYWDSIDAIKGYAGENYTQVHDLPKDKDYLIDHKPLVRHLDLAVNFWQG